MPGSRSTAGGRPLAVAATTFALTFAAAACSPTSQPDPMDEHCWQGSAPLPKCEDGSFLFWDKICFNQAEGQSCSERGDGQCYPFCDANGGCPEGSTCGEVSLYRCTHYCFETVKVCVAGAEPKHLGCQPDLPRADAGVQPGVDSGL